MTKCGGSCCGSPPLPCAPRARSRAASPVLGFRLSFSLSAALSLPAPCLKSAPVFSASVRFYLDITTEFPSRRNARCRTTRALAPPVRPAQTQHRNRFPAVHATDGLASAIRKRWRAPEATKPPRAPACHKPAPIARASRAAPNAGIRALGQWWHLPTR